MGQAFNRSSYRCSKLPEIGSLDVQEYIQQADELELIDPNTPRTVEKRDALKIVVSFALIVVKAIGSILLFPILTQSMLIIIGIAELFSSPRSCHGPCYPHWHAHQGRILVIWCVPPVGCWRRVSHSWLLISIKIYVWEYNMWHLVLVMTASLNTCYISLSSRLLIFDANT